MKILPFIFIFCSVFCFAQNNNKQIGQKKQLELRAGFGVQKSFYSELGIAYHKANYSDVGFASNSFYSAVEYSLSGNIFSVKAGYEANAMLIAVVLGKEKKSLEAEVRQAMKKEIEENTNDWIPGEIYGNVKK